MGGFHISTCGDKGDKGDPGTRWFDGHGPPEFLPDAKEGDFYLDLDTGKIYKLTWS